MPPEGDAFDRVGLKGVTWVGDPDFARSHRQSAKHRLDNGGRLAPTLSLEPLPQPTPPVAERLIIQPAPARDHGTGALVRLRRHNIAASILTATGPPVTDKLKRTTGVCAVHSAAIVNGEPRTPCTLSRHRRLWRHVCCHVLIRVHPWLDRANAARNAATCAGLVPQQPPIIVTPAASNAGSHDAIASGERGCVPS